MFAKFSVKKPFTVLVVVILVLVLGYVSVGKMTPDLLPDMSFQYVVLFTTYPGASPEEVEAKVTKPLEQSMSSLDHIKSVTSRSSENVSTVYLTFEDGTDVDIASIDVQKAIGVLTASWDESIGTPIMMELSSDLIPVTVAAVYAKDMDQLELSAFVRDTLAPRLEGVSGVASVTTSGLIERQVEITLDDDKIDFFLVGNMPGRFLEYIGRIRARQPLVRRDDQEKLLVRRIGFEKRVLEILDARRNALDNLRHLVRERLVRDRRLLRAPKPRRRNHLHRFGDLLDALYAAYSAAYIL